MTGKFFDFRLMHFRLAPEKASRHEKALILVN